MFFALLLQFLLVETRLSVVSVDVVDIERDRGGHVYLCECADGTDRMAKGEAAFTAAADADCRVTVERERDGRETEEAAELAQTARSLSLCPPPCTVSLLKTCEIPTRFQTPGSESPRNEYLANQVATILVGGGRERRDGEEETEEDGLGEDEDGDAAWTGPRLVVADYQWATYTWTDFESLPPWQGGQEGPHGQAEDARLASLAPRWTRLVEVCGNGSHVAGFVSRFFPPTFPLTTLTEVPLSLPWGGKRSITTYDEAGTRFTFSPSPNMTDNGRHHTGRWLFLETGRDVQRDREAARSAADDAERIPSQWADFLLVHAVVGCLKNAANVFVSPSPRHPLLPQYVNPVFLDNDRAQWKRDLSLLHPDPWFSPPSPPSPPSPRSVGSSLAPPAPLSPSLALSYWLRFSRPAFACSTSVAVQSRLLQRLQEARQSSHGEEAFDNAGATLATEIAERDAEMWQEGEVEVLGKRLADVMRLLDTC